MFVVLVSLQTADGTLCVLLFDVWGERYSIFINQGGAFVYITWSLFALGVLSLRRRHARRTPGSTASTPSGGQSRLPWRILVLIGLMNGGANFCMAIAQPHTPGLSQTLLLLLGIPLVLLLSWLALSKRPSAMASLAAGLIIAGTGFSGMRSVLQPAGGEPVAAFGWAVGLFAAAQLFLAAEKIVEESIFGNHPAVHPMVMFCWTLTTQFVLGWALYPLQTLPALGGLHLADLPSVVRDGLLCTVGRPPCGPGHAAVFWAYTCVDFWCYYFGVSAERMRTCTCTCMHRRAHSASERSVWRPATSCRHALPPSPPAPRQLWVLRRGGACLLVLVTAVALPLQQLVLCTRPLLGPLAERFFWGDAISLTLVLLGFMIYQALSPEGRAARQSTPPAPAINCDY